MTVDHAAFTPERTIATTSANVFRACAEEDLNRRWFAGRGPKAQGDDRLGLGVGSTEQGRFEVTEEERTVCACTIPPERSGAFALADHSDLCADRGRLQPHRHRTGRFLRPV